MNRASQFNRRMMFAMLAFAVILLFVVFGMLYLSFRHVQDVHDRPAVAGGDSIILIDHTASDSL